MRMYLHFWLLEGERTPDPEDFVLMNKNSHNNNAYYNISVKMINQMDE